MREHYFVTGTRIGASLSLARNNRNFAGFVSLALRPGVLNLKTEDTFQT